MLKLKRPYTEKFKKSLTYQGPKIWNRLPEGFHHASTKKTCKLLVNKLVSNKAKGISEVVGEVVGEEGTEGKVKARSRTRTRTRTKTRTRTRTRARIKIGQKRVN